MPSEESLSAPGRSSVRIVDKPWGHERIWAATEAYVGKILHVEAGESLSLQYHRVKDETVHVLRGRVRFFAGPSADALEDMVLEPGDSYRITPGTVHRMEAIETCDILEASTPELDDLVRMEDRYGRSSDGP
jgi:mannose-6-phosphate isomerase